MDHRTPVASFGQTVMTPVKDSHTRIKGSALTNGHGRYITATPERALVSCVRLGVAVTCSRYKFVTVALLKRLRNGRFNSQTAVWRFKKRNGHLDPEVV